MLERYNLNFSSETLETRLESQVSYVSSTSLAGTLLMLLLIYYDALLHNNFFFSATLSVIVYYCELANSKLPYIFNE